MKKLFAYACLLSSVAFFSACTLDDDLGTNTADNDNYSDVNETSLTSLTGLTKIDIPEGINKVDIYNWADNKYLGTATVENGHIWIGSSNASMTVKLYNATSSSAKGHLSIRKAPSTSADTVSTDKLDQRYIKDATVYKSNDNVITIEAADKTTSNINYTDFQNIFPEKTDNRNIPAPQFATNFEHDVLYKSDGNAFSIYPIYAGGTYRVNLGVFYYDKDGKKHDIDFWSKYLTGTGNFSGYNTENAQGYKITIPEHYVYGFYIWSSDEKGPYYSYSGENTNCAKDENPNDSIYTGKDRHAANIVDANKNNYLAFEDMENGDWDTNDLINYITPERPVIDQPNESKKQEEIEKIGTVDVPKDVDKIVHGTTPDSCDVEARYDHKGHDYVRIAIPLKNGEEIEFDLDKMNQYCENDDFRIVSAGDIEVIYCKDNSSEEVDCGNSHITVTNGCAEKNYGKVIAYVTGKDGKQDEDGKYEVKIALYPKDEDSFNEIVKLIDSGEWEKLFTIKKTKK